MRNFLIYLICFLSALSAQTQTLPIEQAQVRLGKLLPTDSVRIYVEYPELEPMSRNEVKTFRSMGFLPHYDLQLHEMRGLSRGETWVDVTFVPIVERNGRWYSVKSYEVKTENVGPKVSAAQRAGIQAALRVA